MLRVKKVSIIFLSFLFFNLFSEKKCLGQDNDKSIIENIGIKISLGYSHAVYKTGDSPLRTDVYSLEASLLYDLDLENNWKLYPFIGYSRDILNASDFFYARYKIYCLHAGSYLGHTFNHFIPLVGIVAKKTTAINFFIESVPGEVDEQDVTDTYSSIIYQGIVGVKYRIKKFSFGIEGWLGINYIDNTVGYNPKRLNEYLLSIEYFPFAQQ